MFISINVAGQYVSPEGVLDPDVRLPQYDAEIAAIQAKKAEFIKVFNALLADGHIEGRPIGDSHERESLEAPKDKSGK